VEVTKVYHLIHSFASSIAEGNKTNIWYSAIGVRCSGLLNTDLSAKPAYEAYKFAYSNLATPHLCSRSAQATRCGHMNIAYQSQVMGFLWSLDGGNHPITLPKMPIVVNKVGADGIAVKEANSTSVTIG
jgi:hypothetical protein